MLIIKILSEEKDRKKSLFKRSKKMLYNRRSVLIDNNVYTLIECTDSFCVSEEFQRLLNVYKGQLLLPEKGNLKKLHNEYLFDVRPYLKRAVISGFTKYIKDNIYHNNTLCVIDDNFVFTKEYLDLAHKVRNLVIISENNLEAQRFMDYCYLNLGTFVRFKEKLMDIKWDLYIDLTEVSEPGAVLVRFNDKTSVFFPDNEYFICKWGDIKLNL